MSFDATKHEWSEIYSFFRLLADGVIYAGTAKAQKNPEKNYPIAMIQRTEHDGIRSYTLEEENVHIKGENIELHIPRSKFAEISEIILEAMRDSIEYTVEAPEVVEAFLDEIAIYDLEANTEDRTDYSIAFYSSNAPLVGVNIHSRLSKLTPLLNGGRTANLKFEQTGIKFATPTVNKINAVEGPYEVVDRILMIERLGGVLKYADVADKVFRCNLQMIDLHFPRLIAEMVRTMHLDEITKISDLTERMKETNPLKIKDELINKHHFYEYKVKQFLMALALGMRPAKIYNGTDSAVEGYILIDGKGELMFYSKADRNTFEDFLYYNTRLEKGAPEKDKYGFLERENGVYYFKLNLKIGLTKR